MHYNLKKGLVKHFINSETSSQHSSMKIGIGSVGILYFITAHYPMSSNNDKKNKTLFKIRKG